MPIPTEPIGSIPRPPELIAALRSGASPEELARLQELALRETIQAFQATGSPVITDGEQTKPSFATYPLAGLDNLAPDGAMIPFEDGHTRQLPRLTAGPFRYGEFADGYLARALRFASVPVKQAVIAPSALSLIYPGEPLDGYPRERFLKDLLDGAEADVRRCLDRGAHKVQLDFTEGRLSLKLDPSGGLLDQFIELNNRLLERFTGPERERIGVHTCPGGDQDSTHSADVPYSDLLPKLLGLKAGSFYIQLASERDPRAVLELIRDHARDDQTIFVGVIDPVDPRIEPAEEVRDRTLMAAGILGAGRLGTTDDCGFAPFADDTSTLRETAWAKIRARVQGTAMASERLAVQRPQRGRP